MNITRNKFFQAFSLLVISSPIVMTSSLASGPAATPSGPSTLVCWTPEEVRFVAQGDKNRGEKISKDLFCASCHGTTGIAQSANWPSLAGQRADYLFKELTDYKDDKRHGRGAAAIMLSVTKSMSNQDMADLAQYYASFSLPPLPIGVSFDKKMAAEINPLVTQGDGNRMVPACQACHGPQGEGSVYDMPALAGQTPQYFVKTMEDFRSGKRGNDVYSRMRLIAKDLSDKEIVEIANYYASLTSK
jgi:cytochrome c553